MCQYHFGKFFTERTIVARPLPDTISDETKKQVLCKRDDILCSVKKYIDQNLNPKKKTYFTQGNKIL